MFLVVFISNYNWGLRGGDHVVGGFTSACTISAYHHYHCEFESHSWWSVPNTLVDTVCQWLVVVSGYPGFHHKSSWQPRYNWNIVESEFKHKVHCYIYFHQLYVHFYIRVIITVVYRHTELDIYVLITMTGSIHPMVDYRYLKASSTQ